MTTEQIIRAINDCSFLGEGLVEKWKKNLKNIPEEFYGLIYRTFLEAKREVDGLYMEIELARDENGEYAKLLNGKVAEIVKLVNRQKLGNLEVE